MPICTESWWLLVTVLQGVPDCFCLELGLSAVYWTTDGWKVVNRPMVFLIIEI